MAAVRSQWQPLAALLACKPSRSHTLLFTGLFSPHPHPHPHPHPPPRPTPRLQVISKAFNQWQEAAEGFRTEDLIHSTLLALGAEKLAVGFRCFRHAIMLSRREMRAFDLWANRIDEHGERMARRQELKERAGARMRALQYSKAFETWYEYAEAHEHYLQCAGDAVQKLRNMQLGKGFRSWQETAWLRKHAIALMHRLKDGKLYACLLTWQDLAESRGSAQEATKRVVLRMMAQRLAKGFNTWAEYAEASGDAKMRMRNVLAHLMLRNLSRAYAQWQDVHASKKRTLDLVANACGAYNTRYMRAGLVGWRISCAILNDLKKRLKQWHKMVTEGDVQRAAELDLMEKCVRQLTQLKLSAYFITMCRTLDMERCLYNAVQRLAQREISRALAAWASRTFDEQEEVSKFETAFRRLANMALSKGFAQWAEYAGERQYAMSCLERSMNEMRMTVFGWVVPRWADYVDYLHKVKRSSPQRPLHTTSPSSCSSPLPLL